MPESPSGQLLQVHHQKPQRGSWPAGVRFADLRHLSDPDSFPASGRQTGAQLQHRCHFLRCERALKQAGVVLLLMSCCWFLSLLYAHVSVFRDLDTAGCHRCTLACMEIINICFCYLFMLLCEKVLCVIIPGVRELRCEIHRFSVFDVSLFIQYFMWHFAALCWGKSSCAGDWWII